MLRLYGVAHHVEDVPTVDRHEQLQSFFSCVGVVAYCEALCAFLDLALDSLCALDAYEVGFAVLVVESDVVVILAGNSAEIGGISELNLRHEDAVIIVVVADVVAVLSFEVSDVYAVVVVLEDILDIESERDQLVGAIPVYVADYIEERTDRVDYLIGVCVCRESFTEGFFREELACQVFQFILLEGVYVVHEGEEEVADALLILTAVIAAVADFLCHLFEQQICCDVCVIVCLCVVFNEDSAVLDLSNEIGYACREANSQLGVGVCRTF